LSVITLDFESPYGKGARQDHILHKYSLTGKTYEQYITDERFKVFGVGIKIDDGETNYYSNEALNRPRPADVLAEIFTPGNDHTLVAHNALFDGAILSWHYGLEAARYWCTKMISKAIWNQRSAGLEQLCISCFPDDPTVRKGKELEDFANVYDLNSEQDDAMALYCANDVDITFKCLTRLWPVMPDDELELLDITLKAFIHPAFVLNRDILVEFLETYNAETDRIVEASGVARSTLASPAKFVRYVKDKLDLDIPIVAAPTIKNPDNEKHALGKDSFEFLQFRDDHPEHKHIWDARLRVASTIARSRAERMIDHADRLGGVIAMPLNYYTAHTGRWGGTNKLNPQNFQRGSVHRKALTAPEGYQVIVADQSNIEGRKNAWFNQQKELLDTFAAGGDIYNDFATKIFGRPIDRKAVDDEGNEYMWMEGFVGKTCQLGLGYQTGAAKLQKTLYMQSNGEVDFSLEQCQDIVWNDYRGTYTDIVDGWEECQFIISKMHSLGPDEQMPWRCLIVEKGRLRLPNNMHLNYPDLKVEIDERDRPQYSYWNGKHRTNLYGGKLMENIIQALARIVIAQNILDINRWLTANRDRFGALARVVLTVHDEIIVLARTQYAREVFNKMLEFMAIPPDWCNDGTLVLKAEGGIDSCYSK